LREAIMVTLLYKRQNIIEEVIADLFGISQGTVSEIIASSSSKNSGSNSNSPVPTTSVGSARNG
jgi:Helix-turn-helix of DDE superfamily endonuclease